MEKEFLKWDVKPHADENNIVKGEFYRFTVITPGLIRMEYDPSGIFEDRASQSVFYRDLGKNEFSVTKNDGMLTIETESVKLCYEENKKFDHNTLFLALKLQPCSIWHFGDRFQDLGGTVRTLDNINGAVPLGHGVCSREGFSIIDDSDTVMLEDDGQIGVRQGGTLDFYYFGYGCDYLGAIKDCYRLTGIPPLLPAYSLGNWWSRYHEYTQEEYLSLMERFKEEDIPFNVAVIDMDWHTTDYVDREEHLRNERFGNGWTGFSWNKKLFPNYKLFLKKLKELGLKTSLNLHPALGIRRNEDMYAQMAEAMGVDPKSEKRIPLDILNPEFMRNYFDIVLHPYEKDGVDFWWMDWQQGKNYWWIHEPGKEYNDPREAVDPLWLLNHHHILDISSSGKRPMFFSRFSGPGSQRYPVGFSGDTQITWDSLKFQPYFTACASNIGYSWWSHDIGGHFCGYSDFELTARWIQLGVFSPINRIHSTNNDFIRKEPWMMPEGVQNTVKKALRLRTELFPYIYTMNYRNHTELLPLVQPMYYSHPREQEAYTVENQYWFGSEMIVSPISEHTLDSTSLAGTDVWFPEGIWTDIFNGAVYNGGRKLKVYRSVSDFPVFAKAGAIIPQMIRKKNDNRLTAADKLKVFVFPGADNIFDMYEDEGEYNNYKNGMFAVTKMHLHWQDNKALFTINAAQGETSLIPQNREWTVMFRGFSENAEILAKVENETQDCSVFYDAETATYSVSVTAAVTKQISIEVKGDKLISDNAGVLDKCTRILINSKVGYEWKDKIQSMLNKGNDDLHKEIIDLYSACSSKEQYEIIDAIKEQLLLKRSEF